MTIGRNDPCPCGSGRKHKHCCLPAAGADDRLYERLRACEGAVVDKVMRFARRSGGEHALAEALAEFHLGLAPPEEEPDMQAFVPWLVFDRTGEGFLAAEGGSLSEAERSVEEAMADAQREERTPEGRRRRREHEAFQRRPEIRELAQRMADAQWEAWIHTNVPALGGRTPAEAVRDPEGRERVEALLTEFDRSNATRRPGEPRVDVPDLRRRLGLTPEARLRPRKGTGSGAAGTISHEHDVVLVDQRGTGQGHRLDCPSPGSDNDLEGYLNGPFDSGSTSTPAP